MNASEGLQRRRLRLKAETFVAAASTPPPWRPGGRRNISLLPVLPFETAPLTPQCHKPLFYCPLKLNPVRMPVTTNITARPITMVMIIAIRAVFSLRRQARSR